MMVYGILNIISGILHQEFYLPRLYWHFHMTVCVKPLLNEKNLNQSNLKRFTDGKINVIQKLRFVLEGVENIVEKGENAGYQHFLLFPQCFQKAFS